MKAFPSPPVTKLEIEQIRGVRAERVLAQLIARELVTEVGRKNVIGRPILYGTTETFLRSFGLRDLTELPTLPEADAEEVNLFSLSDEALPGNDMDE